MVGPWDDCSLAVILVDEWDLQSPLANCGSYLMTGQGNGGVQGGQYLVVYGLDCCHLNTTMLNEPTSTVLDINSVQFLKWSVNVLF